MCGIFGHYAIMGADSALIERMAFRLAHRGPDGCGTHSDPGGRFVFGAGRLAIIDLSAHPGILFSEDRASSVAFNGEIYNYKVIRAELERAGHRFATDTDTEVIVHGYEQWGADVIGRLRGMFGLAIWDSVQERLILARDRIGEKPLYYAEVGDREVVFASEVKALYEHPGLKRAIDPNGIGQFLSLGYTLPPITAFAGVNKLAPGEMRIYSRGSGETCRYWTPVMNAAGAPLYGETVKQVRQAVEDAVTMEMMSDVPIGAFLSGGVDSTTVVALMRRALGTGQRLQTFTVGFDVEPDSNADHKFNVDARAAADVAHQFGTEHHAIYLRQDERISDLLPHLIYHQDDLIAMPSIVQTAYVAALARVSNVPVLLNGEAGDELFMGYNHYRADHTLSRYQTIPVPLRAGLLDPLFARLPGTRFDPLRKLAEKSHIVDPVERYLTWTHILDESTIHRLVNREVTTHSPMGDHLRQPVTDHFTDRLAYGNLIGFVGENSNMRVDKMCMAMSIEARSPLEDYPLVELAFRLPLAYKLRGGDFKRVFKDAVRDLVPPHILKRPKWGFNPPASNWLRGALQPLIRRVLTSEYVRAVGVFDAEAVAAAIKTHMSGGYKLWEVWTALIFHVWHAIFIDQSLKLDAPIRAADLVDLARVERVSA